MLYLHEPMTTPLHGKIFDIAARSLRSLIAFYLRVYIYPFATQNVLKASSFGATCQVCYGIKNSGTACTPRSLPPSPILPGNSQALRQLASDNLWTDPDERDRKKKNKGAAGHRGGRGDQEGEEEEGDESQKATSVMIFVSKCRR